MHVKRSKAFNKFEQILLFFNYVFLMPTKCFNTGKFTEEQNFTYDIGNGMLQNSQKSV